MTPVRLLLGVHGIDVLLQVAAAYVRAAEAAFGGARVAAGAVRGERLARVEALIAHLAGEVCRKPQPVAVVHLYVRVQGVDCGRDGAAVLARVLGEVGVELPGMVV